jgi:hypothetical protein
MNQKREGVSSPIVARVDPEFIFPRSPEGRDESTLLKEARQSEEENAYPA